jgi:tetratricopeptide (TPR) repeat protein
MKRATIVIVVVFVRLVLLVIALCTMNNVPTPAAPQTAACGPTLYDCAIAQVGTREFGAAIRTLEQLLAQAPKDLKALNLLGIALIGADRRDEANARFRAALAIDPRFHPARKNLAINEFQAGRLDEAQRHFEEVVKDAPDDEIVQVHLGEIHFHRKRRSDALPHYERARARVAQNPQWTLHYAICLLDGGRPGRTADAVAVLDRLPLDDVSSRFEAGVALGEARAYAEAARFFGSARASAAAGANPNANANANESKAYEAGYNQTLMLIEAGDADAAIRVAEEMFGQGAQRPQRPLGSQRPKGQQALPDPKAAELRNLVSRAYAKAGRIKEAYDALREASRLEPTVAEHYIDLAMLCLEHENYDLGLEIVDVGLKHRPDASMLYLQRGVVLAMKGAIEQAEKEFDRATRAAPDDPAPYVALAMTWMLQNETPKAVEMLRARTRTGEPRAVLFYALGMALLRSGAAPDDEAGTEAMEAFRTATRLTPDFSQAQAELGKLLLKRNDVPGAIEHLEKALALEPNESAPAYVLAQAYRRSGRIDRAQELLARVSRLNAQERGDDTDGNRDLKRMVVRIVRESTTTRPAAAVSAAASAGGATGAAGATGAVAAAGAAANGANGGAAHGVAIAARYERAMSCASSGDVDGAIAEMRRIVDAAPTLAAARYQLGVNLWTRFKRPVGGRQKQDQDDAIAHLTRAVEIEPAQPLFHLVLGQLLAEQQRLAPAIEHLRRALGLASSAAPVDTAPTGTANPATVDPAEYPYNLGLALRLNGNLDEAETQFRAALARNPAHALARRSLGLVLRHKEDAAAAVVELRRAVALLPDDAQGHHLLATALLKLGDVPGATTELREAVRLDPTLIEARVTLTQALARSGHKDEALKEQAEIRRLNAEKADFGRMLVLLDSSAERLDKGDLAIAIAQRREAIVLSPRFAEAHYQLGAALRLMPADQTADAEAETALRQAITLDPNHARAFAELARLLDVRGDKSGAEQARQRAATLAPCS